MTVPSTPRSMTPEQSELLQVLLDREGLTTALTRRPDSSAATPLSPAQRRLWLQDQLADRAHLPSPNTHIRAWRLYGALDHGRLRRSLDTLIQRHEILRTSITSIGGEPFQVVEPADVCPVHVLNLSGNPARAEQAMHSLLAEEVARPVSAHTPPLIRAAIARVGHRDHLFLLAQHYMAADGVGESLLLDEMSAIYNAEPLPAASGLQYADYAAWRERISRSSEHRARVRESAEALVGVAALPPMWNRGAGNVRSARGGRVRLDLDARTSRAVADASRNLGVTPFAFLLCAFQVTCYRLTGRDQVLVSTTVSDRPHLDLERMLGSFSNIVPIPARIPPDETFADFVGRQRAVLARAFANQSATFEEVAESLAGSGRRPPAIETVFVLHDRDPGTALRLNGIEAEPLATPDFTIPFDVHLRVIDTGSVYRLELGHRYGALDVSAAEALTQAYSDVLRAVAVDAAVDISSLELAPWPDRPSTISDNRHIVPGEPPVGDIEELLTAIWSEVLDAASPPSVTANIFDLGAQSLHVTLVRRRIEAALKVTLPMLVFFENPTIRALSAYLSGSAEIDTETAAVPGEENRALRDRHRQRAAAARMRGHDD